MLVRLVLLLSMFVTLPALAAESTRSSSSEECDLKAKNETCAVLYRQLKRLSRNGSSEATTLLAYMHMYGEEGIAKDPEKAIELLEKAVRRKSASAQFELAKHLLDGKYIEADPQKAMQLLRAAAIKGHSGAALVYHMVLVEHPGTSQEDRQALIERIKTLELDRPEYAHHFLGHYYLQQGQNDDARDYLSKASNAGHLQARKLLQENFPDVEFSDVELQQLDMERITVSSESLEFADVAREVINQFAENNGLYSRKQTGSRIPGRGCEVDNSCFALYGFALERFLGTR